MKLMWLVLFLSLATPVVCQENAWRGIVPLRSTRADVEKLLGKPTKSSVDKFAATYDTEVGRVFVLYSSGACSVKPSNGWNLPELTVISVSVYPNPEPAFDESKIDLNSFEKRPDPEILSSVAYTNHKSGVSITVNSWDKVIDGYHYWPPSEFYHLKCKKE